MLNWFRSASDDETDDEVIAHLELQTRKYMAEGMSAEAARRRARIDFGGVERTREECRDIDHWFWLDSARRSFGYALRLLRRSPGFSAVAILILAVAFGTNLAVFNLMNALLFRPLPVKDPGRLTHIALRNSDGRLGSTFSTLLDPLRSVREFEGVCGFDTSYEAIEAAHSVSSAGIEAFTGDCFATLGIRTELGRAITPADDHPGTAPIVVITDALWRSAFARSRTALGQQVRIENRLYTIVGVAEPRFSGLLTGFPAGVVMPLHQRVSRLPGGRQALYYWINVLARRAPGISESQAAARLKAAERHLLEASVPPTFGPNRRRAYLAGSLALESARSGIDYFLRARFGQYLWAMFGVCACLLLIGCVNLSSLLLARGIRRSREVAVRFALGASRNHVAGIFVVEAILLVSAGAALGLLLAEAMDRAIAAECATVFGNFDLRPGLDGRAVLFLFAACAAAAAAFTGVAVRQTDPARVSGRLREEGRGIAGAHARSQNILVAVQIALTMALVTGSALLSTSLKQWDSLGLGFDTANVEDAMLSPRPNTSTSFPPPDYYRDVLQRVGALPGVTSVSLSDFVPLYTFTPPEPVAAIEGAQAGRELPSTILAASRDVFRTLGIRTLAGGFRPEEDGSGEPEVILSQSLAERIGDPRALIGRHIRIGSDPRYQRLSIAGIASNSMMSLANAEDRKPYIAWINIWQHADRQGYPVVLIRTAGAPVAVDTLRRTIDPHGPFFVDRVRTLDAEKDGALMENRLLAWLSGAFAFMALAMAATGLFGVLSYQVTLRTSEIGVRMALGARRAQIVWLISRQTLTLAAGGCLAGIVLSLVAGRAIAGMLYGVRPNDPLLLAASCAVLIATAMMAAWLPVHRASSTDPLTALRHE